VADPALPIAARPLAELLRACLDWHFGAEVQVAAAGPAATVTPDALAGDDIALSSPAEPARREPANSAARPGTPARLTVRVRGHATAPPLGSPSHPDSRSAVSYRPRAAAGRAVPRGSVSPATDAERERLSAGLARQRDWSALWRAALGFPLPRAIAAVRLLDPGWRPADEQGRQLLARLAGHGPAPPGADWLAAPEDQALTTVRVELPGDGMNVMRGSFSPDGRRLALLVRHVPPGGGLRSIIIEVDLPHGEQLARYTYPAGQDPDSVLHLGAAILVPMGETRFERGRLDMLADGVWGECGHSLDGITALAPHEDGFVAVQKKRSGPLLLFCDAEGRVRRGDPLAYQEYDYVEPRRLAVDPGSGQVAVCDREGMRVYRPPGGQLAARWRPDVSPEAMCFLGADRIAGVGRAISGDAYVVTWQADGTRLLRQRVHEAVRSIMELPDIVAVPALGEVAIRLADHSSRSGGRVRYLDARTLAEVGGEGGRAGPGWRACKRLWGSPDGRAHALGGEGAVDVVLGAHPLAPLLEQPMSELSPADLASVTGALGRQEDFPFERPALDLLRACLEYRLTGDGPQAFIGAALRH
jgi:hypothetical protein